MIETSLQISCDGGWPNGSCNETVVSEENDITKTEFRHRMEKYGWRCSKKGDFCRRCVTEARKALTPVDRQEHL